MNRQNQQLREDMNRQNQQLREDMDRQFARQFRLTLALLGAFSALVAAIIGFALWDRRTMLRPLEHTVTNLTEDLSSQPAAYGGVWWTPCEPLGQRNPAKSPACSNSSICCEVARTCREVVCLG